MVAFTDKPILPFTTALEWENYLAGTPDVGGVRLKLRKKNAVDPGLDRQEALEVALCFGWIDGQSSGFDEQFQLQSYTPRRRTSPWSKINIEHAERLVVEGRMRPAGLAEIERAKADGRWDAAYRQRDGDVPEAVRAALLAAPTASLAWDSLPATARFGWVFRFSQLRRADTRERHIAELIAALERGEPPG